VFETVNEWTDAISNAYAQEMLLVGFEGRFDGLCGAAILSVARRFTKQGSRAGGDPFHQVAVVCTAMC
jgi:hypothetical protein